MALPPVPTGTSDLWDVLVDVSGVCDLLILIVRPCVSVAVSVEGTVMVLLRLDSSTAGGSWNEVTERSGNWLMSGEVGAVTGKGEVADVEASGDGGCMIEALVEAGEVGGDLNVEESGDGC